MAREPILKDTLEQYLAEVNRYPLLTREQEYALAKRFQETGDPDAARALVTANLRFVVKIAYQFANYDIKLTDLVQEGNIGLMKAVAKFKPDRGYRLISYAVWWIKAYIQNYIIQSWSLVKVGPVSQQRRVLFGRRGVAVPDEIDGIEPVPLGRRLGVDKATLEHLPDEGEAVEVEVVVEDGSEEEDETFLIAAEAVEGTRVPRTPRVPTEAEVDGWRKAAHAARHDLSLDASVSEDGRMTLAETMASPGPSIEEAYASAETTSIVAERLSELHAHLNDKEIAILNKRLLSDSEVTLQEIGDEFGISRERVRQIETNLKKKIAKLLEGLHPVGLLEPPR
ncbi:MAG: sigma-70 family RNA polymerase sigma factor [Myxococcota bacterium]